MRNRTSTAAVGEARLMDTEELRAYTNLGRNNAMKLGEEIGAKVKMIRSMTSMSENEEIILLVNYSSNGKSGIVLTNYYFREYNRGFFGSNSNDIAVKNIQNIVCCGENQYCAEGNVFEWLTICSIEIETI